MKRRIATLLNIDDEAYPLADELRQNIIGAYDGVISREEVTEQEVEVSRQLLIETQSYWKLHHEGTPPRVSDALAYLRREQARVRKVLEMLDGKWGSDRLSRTRVAVRGVIDNWFLSRSEQESAPLITSLGEFEAVLQAFADAEPLMTASIRNAVDDQDHLDRLMVGVAERIFKPRRLSQSYVTHGKDRSSDVALVARRLALLLPVEMRPPTLATMEERHTRLLPKWRAALSETLARDDPSLSPKQIRDEVKKQLGHRVGKRRRQA
jgi:hypothetical protein